MGQANCRYSGPVRLVLDNARYQHCALVMDLAKSLNIELLFLPERFQDVSVLAA